MPHPRTTPAPKIGGSLAKASLGAASPKIGFSAAKNLFANGYARPAKPAKDIDDESHSSSSTSSMQQPFKAFIDAASNHQAGPVASSISSDSENSSDDSRQERRKEKSLIFPPPRPTTQAERDRIYDASQTTPITSLQSDRASTMPTVKVSSTLPISFSLLSKGVQRSFSLTCHCQP